MLFATILLVFLSIGLFFKFYLMIILCMDLVHNLLLSPFVPE